MSRWRALHSCTRGCRSTQARRSSTMSNRKITACTAVIARKSRVCACMCVREEGDVEWRITFNTFMEGIYKNIPETNHLSRVAVLRLQYVVHIMPSPCVFILPLFRSTCPVPSTAVLGTSSSSSLSSSSSSSSSPPPPPSSSSSSSFYRLRRHWRSCCCCCCWDLLVCYNIPLW